MSRLFISKCMICRFLNNSCVVIVTVAVAVAVQSYCAMPESTRFIIKFEGFRSRLKCWNDKTINTITASQFLVQGEYASVNQEKFRHTSANLNCTQSQPASAVAALLENQIESVTPEISFYYSSYINELSMSKALK